MLKNYSEVALYCNEQILCTVRVNILKISTGILEIIHLKSCNAKIEYAFLMR